MVQYLYLCLVLILVSCGSEDLEPFPNPLFNGNQKIGEVESNLLNEISGIVASRTIDNALWAHNDKGDGARIYLMHETGKHLGIFNLNGIAARDWEDIAIGPGPKANQDYIYIADIGDNDEISKVLYIYRFLEPTFDNSLRPIEQTIQDIDVIEVVFDDKPRDAETMLIDPITKDLFIVTKNTKLSKVYRLPFPQALNRRNSLAHVIDLSFTEAVGGDISSDGQEVLIKSYDSIYYWNKQTNQSYSNLFSQQPIILPYNKEPQGEAIAWKADGSGYYSISEQIDDRPAPIFFYKRN